MASHQVYYCRTGAANRSVLTRSLSTSGMELRRRCKEETSIGEDDSIKGLKRKKKKNENSHNKSGITRLSVYGRWKEERRSAVGNIYTPDGYISIQQEEKEDSRYKQNKVFLLPLSDDGRASSYTRHTRQRKEKTFNKLHELHALSPFRCSWSKGKQYRSGIFIFFFILFFFLPTSSRFICLKSKSETANLVQYIYTSGGGGQGSLYSPGLEALVVPRCDDISVCV